MSNFLQFINWTPGLQMLPDFIAAELAEFQEE
jgi:hypothetical protein